MFELYDIRAGNIDQRSIGLHNTIRNERFHAKMVILNSHTLKITSRKDQSSEILFNSLQQRFGRSMMQTSSSDMLIASIAIDTHIIPHVSFASAAKSFDGKDLAFFHALGGFGLDEGDLFAAVDLVAEDVVAGDVADCFDGDGFVVEFDFVAFHYFLDGGADVVHSGVDAGFLGGLSGL